MEVEEMQTQSCKFPRIRNGNGRIDSAKIGQKRGEDQYPPDGEVKRGSSGGNGGGRGSGVDGGGGGGGGGLDISGPGGFGRLCGWPSSRIVRVSRASGGKDRHSKVWTSKGPRDRRVRLSVNTAIQFYDLQDRLGYNQPSKAVEWLLRQAASSIAELPLINTFPDTPQQLSDGKRSGAGTEHGFDSVEVEMEGEPNFQQQQPGTLSKSACSSTSETSKGSGLSLSRSESRIKARERARERAAEKEKEKENESSRGDQQQHQNVNPVSQSSSFTELLTSGINGTAANVSNNNNTTSPNSSVHQNAGGGGGGGGGNNGTPSESNRFQKSPRQWSSTMDYFTTGLLGPSSTRAPHQSSSSLLGQIQLGNHLQNSLATVSSPLFSVTGDHHSEIPHFSFVPDHLFPVVTTAGGGSSDNNNSGDGEYNLNFTISSSSSSGIAGFNRGTLQSNSSTPSLLPQFQRFTPMGGPSAFYIGTAAPQNAAVASVENHHHILPRFDAALQLCYGDSGRHSDHKGKGKN